MPRTRHRQRSTRTCQALVLNDRGVHSSCGQPIPEHDPHQVCPSCMTDLITSLQGLPDLIDDVTLTATRQTANGDRVGPRGTVTPLPFHDAADVLADVLRDLTTWARKVVPTLIRERHTAERTFAHRITNPPIPADSDLLPLIAIRASRNHRIAWLTGPRDRIHPASLLRFLIERVDELTTSTEGLTFVDTIARTQARLIAASDSPAPMLYFGPCLADPLEKGVECPEVLFVIDHSDRGHDHTCIECSSIRCGTCGTEHDVVARRAWMAREIDDRLASAGDIARGLATTTGYEVTIGQIKGWKSRGRLVTHGRTRPGEGDKGEDVGEWLYRVGDVIDLARDAAEGRKGTRTA